MYIYKYARHISFAKNEMKLLKINWIDLRTFSFNNQNKYLIVANKLAFAFSLSIPWVLSVCHIHTSINRSFPKFNPIPERLVVHHKNKNNTLGYHLVQMGNSTLEEMIVSKIVINVIDMVCSRLLIIYLYVFCVSIEVKRVCTFHSIIQYFYYLVYYYYLVELHTWG